MSRSAEQDASRGDVDESSPAPSEGRSPSIVYAILTGDDEGRVCRDIPEEACDEQPRSFLTHVACLSATKTGDGLVDPKIVLSWLLAALGASSVWIGWLVPIREAGALVPQLFVAGRIRALPRRKWVWVGGSLVQGASVLTMGLLALLEGEQAGSLVSAAIIACLVVFALGRSLCSVSYKDVLGKTVSKSTRGTATGSAATLASVLVLVFGVLLSTGLLERSVTVVALALCLAGALWIAAAGLFATLPERSGATEGGGNAFVVAREQLGLLRDDPQLVRFIAVRALLLATALSPPYLVALADGGRPRALGELGPFVVASALAAVTSTYVWGRLSDVSSRRVLILASLVAALALAAAAVQASRSWLQPWALPGILFVLMIAYQGVRLGRSTHVVDMADPERRAAYTALSNTAIGALLVAGGAFGVLARSIGASALFVVFAAMCLGAAGLALGLREEQAEPPAEAEARDA